MYAEPGIETITSAEYHPQCNGQVERFNQTTISHRRYYVAESQKDEDSFFLSATYVYNIQANRSQKTSPLITCDISRGLDLQFATSSTLQW